MERRPKLHVAAVDAWRLAAEAIKLGLVEQARALADRALEISGWAPYEQGFSYGRQGIRYSLLIAPTYAYYGKDGDEERLLVHPGAGTFVAQIDSLDLLFRAARQHGGGLLPLDELEGDVLIATLTPPDDVSELSA